MAKKHSTRITSFTYHLSEGSIVITAFDPEQRGPKYPAGAYIRGDLFCQELFDSLYKTKRIEYTRVKWDMSKPAPAVWFNDVSITSEGDVHLAFKRQRGGEILTADLPEDDFLDLVDCELELV